MAARAWGFGGPHCQPWAQFLGFVQAPEVLGFDSFWRGDHPLWGPDCWATLAALAVSTRSIRLGTTVNCIDWRTPVELARASADVDRWSDGRLVLGLGTGDNVGDEYRRMGVARLPLRDRQVRLDETVRIVRGLWGPTPFTFEGSHYQVADANVVPGPVQQPRVPLLVCLIRVVDVLVGHGAAGAKPSR